MERIGFSLHIQCSGRYIRYIMYHRAHPPVSAPFLFATVALIAACGGDSGAPTGGGANGPDLRIETLYLVQSVQTRDGSVPLVAGKDAELRVFVLASGSNTLTPAVRVRLYRGGVLQQTLTIPAPAASVPT